jgi:hypothetical protein
VNDDEYRELQNRMAAAPELGDVVPGTGGFGSFAGRTRGAAKEGEEVYG